MYELTACRAADLWPDRTHLQEDALEQLEAGVALLRPAERRQRERVVRVLVLTGVHVLPESAQPGHRAGQAGPNGAGCRSPPRDGSVRDAEVSDGVHTGLARLEMHLPGTLQRAMSDG